jgi:hypothetical protein
LTLRSDMAGAQTEARALNAHFGELFKNATGIAG